MRRLGVSINRATLSVVFCCLSIIGGVQGRAQSAAPAQPAAPLPPDYTFTLTAGPYRVKIPNGYHYPRWTTATRVICPTCPFQFAFTWPDLGYVEKTPLFGGKWEGTTSDGRRRLTIEAVQAHYVFVNDDHYTWNDRPNSIIRYVRPSEQFHSTYSALLISQPPIVHEYKNLRYFLIDANLGTIYVYTLKYFDPNTEIIINCAGHLISICQEQVYFHDYSIALTLLYRHSDLDMWRKITDGAHHLLRQWIGT